MHDLSTDFLFVADHSLVRSWSNNRKKSNGRESGGLRVVTSLFCAPALKSRLILCCVNFVSMRTVKQSKFYISSLIIGVLVKEKQRRRTSSHQIRIDKAFYAILHLIHQKPAVSPPNLHLPWTWQILKGLTLNNLKFSQNWIVCDECRWYMFSRSSSLRH